MRVEQEKVREFMDMIGDHVSNKPTLVDQDAAVRRCKLITEEADEYEEANLSGDLVKVADAIGDLAYVVIGAAVMHGIDLQPIFDEVHRSNMTKEPFSGNDYKLCRKGPSFEPPRLADLLIMQATGLHPII